MNTLPPYLPQATVGDLRRLHVEALAGGPGSFECNTFCYFLRSLTAAGWRISEIGRALGMTRQGAHRWHQMDAFACATPVVPLPPLPPAPEPKQRKPLILPSAEEISRLQSLWAVAKTVNGGTRSDDPRRATSVELSGFMAALVERGVSYYRLAKLMGLTINGVKFRLARHGYFPAPPSYPDRYIGRAQFERA